MSGVRPSARSPWLGEGETDSTTDESGWTGSETRIMERIPLVGAKRKRSRQPARTVQDR
jgi:hypothetical protein